MKPPAVVAPLDRIKDLSVALSSRFVISVIPPLALEAPENPSTTTLSQQLPFRLLLVFILCVFKR